MKLAVLQATRLETRLETAAEERMRRAKARDDCDEGHHQHDLPNPSAVPDLGSCAGVQANVRDLKEMQTWLMETGIPLLLSGAQEDARVAFEEKIGSLTAGNPGLAVILEDAGLSVLQPDIGAKIRQLVSEQEEILAELGTGTKKRRGRPFGTRNRAKDPAMDQDNKPKKAKGRKRRAASRTSPTRGAEENHPEEDGPLLTPERPDRPKTKKRRQEPPFKDGDPFAEMEEKDSNKNATIPLYTKAMIVEFALKLHRENSVTSIEREVMSRFKKFFFSYESNAWKSGLLGKWTRYLAVNWSHHFRKSFLLFEIHKHGSLLEAFLFHSLYPHVDISIY